MAKSPEQILANYRQHAERSHHGLDIARAQSDPDLAAANLGQGLKACLMQGLIGWRCGIMLPVAPFREGLSFVRPGQLRWDSMNGSISSRTLHLPLEKTLFLALLVNERPASLDLKGLVADRLLDAILGRGLQEEWNEEIWMAGVAELRTLKGSSLAVESYITYHRLLRSSEHCDVKATVDRSIALFEKRKNNGFYGGGEQTDGGGDYNAITVDYRLAAIMKKIGYASGSVHCWRWG
jgi:hypothetical protein